MFSYVKLSKKKFIVKYLHIFCRICCRSNYNRMVECLKTSKIFFECMVCYSEKYFVSYFNFEFYNTNSCCVFGKSGIYLLMCVI